MADFYNSKPVCTYSRLKQIERHHSPEKLCKQRITVTPQLGITNRPFLPRSPSSPPRCGGGGGGQPCPAAFISCPLPSLAAARTPRGRGHGSWGLLWALTRTTVRHRARICSRWETAEKAKKGRPLTITTINSTPNRRLFFFPCSISDRSFAHATPDHVGGQMRRVSSEAPQGNKRPQEVKWGFFFADPTAHTPDQTQQLVKAISTTFLSCEGFK